MAYHPDTGAELWRCNGMSFEVIPTPVVGYGLVFCSSGRAGPTLAIRPGGKGDVTGSHLAWSTPRGSPFVPSPMLYNDQLYTVNDMASIVTSFEAGDRQGAVAGTPRRGPARGLLGVAGCGRRQGLLHERRGRDVRAEGRADVRAAARQPASASGRSPRRRWSTATGTSGPISTCSRSERNSLRTSGFGPQTSGLRLRTSGFSLRCLSVPATDHDAPTPARTRSLESAT